MIETLPYGSNVLIEAIASNLDKDQFPLGHPDFISTPNNISSIVFKCTPKNCKIESLSTNLNGKLVRKNGYVKIILSNDTRNIIDKPFIKLLCNEVEVPIAFDGNDNKWYALTVKSGNMINISGLQDNVWINICKTYKIGWNENNYKNYIFYERNTSSATGEYYNCTVDYYYLENGVIKSGSSMVWSNSYTYKNFYIIPPKLDGSKSKLIYGSEDPLRQGFIEKNFINYFIIKVMVKLSDGYSSHQPDTVRYIDGINYAYNSTGFLQEINGKCIVESTFGIPNTNNIYDKKWNTKFLFKALKDNNVGSVDTYYISPSTSEIKYDLEDYCSHCPRDTDMCFEYCPGVFYCSNNIPECDPESPGCETKIDCNPVCDSNIPGETPDCNPHLDCTTEGDDEDDCPFYMCYFYTSCNSYSSDEPIPTNPTNPTDPTSNEPWESEKTWAGGTGYSWSAIAVYDHPNGTQIASIPYNNTFSVYYSWNGWYETADGWISGNANWDYSY